MQQSLGAADRARERCPCEMPLRRAGQMVVPDILKRVVETYAFKAMIEPNGPVMLPCQGGQGDLGEVFKADDLDLFFWRMRRRTLPHPAMLEQSTVATQGHFDRSAPPRTTTPPEVSPKGKAGIASGLSFVIQWL